MTTYDDDDPLDVGAVSDDDALVEQLRGALSPDAAVVWDDDDDEIDPAFALLRSLQRDVSADLPAAAGILPAGVTELLPRRRRLGRGATVAAVAAGVLSIAGVAAAAPGQPLAAVRSAVSSAVSDVVHAMTPRSPVGPTAAKPSHSARPTPTATSRGDIVEAAVRNAAAVAQVGSNLDRASAFLDAGKYTPAGEQLDAAARKLGFVTDPSAHAVLATRLTSLRARLAARPAPGASGSDNGSHGNSKDNGNGNGGTTGNGVGHDATPGATHGNGNGKGPKVGKGTSEHSGTKKGNGDEGQSTESPRPSPLPTSSPRPDDQSGDTRGVPATGGGDHRTSSRSD
jgi:hypothetical protein